MNNEGIINLILSPSGKLSALAKLLEQQERIAKSINPALTMSDSMLSIGRYYENLNKNNNFQISFTIPEILKNLTTQTSDIASRYSKYHNQLNNFISALNPLLASFFENNSSSVINSYKTINPIDFGIINSFESINDNYDDKTQIELEEIKETLNSKPEFKEEVSGLINESTSEITTDIYFKFSQIIEKHVGKKNSKTIALFLSLLLTIYFVIIPLYQNYLSSESENRQIERIESVKKEIDSKIEDSKSEILEKIEEKESQNNLVVEKLDEINEKLDDKKQ